MIGDQSNDYGSTVTMRVHMVSCRYLVKSAGALMNMHTQHCHVVFYIRITHHNSYLIYVNWIGAEVLTHASRNLHVCPKSMLSHNFSCFAPVGCPHMYRLPLRELVKTKPSI